MNHIFSVIKPPGLSSHDLVALMRRNTGIRKIGHGGTLDPGAAGVMILCSGKYTRLLEYILLLPKCYRAELTLGYSTSSMDLFSPITDEKEIISRSDAEWNAILNRFLGKQFQTPPMTSAIKIDGERLYDLARKEIEIEIPVREIEVFAISLIANYGNKIVLDINCSSGTYIRSLLFDIAKASGNLGVMSFLIRKSVGDIHLADSTLPNENIRPLPWQRVLTGFGHLVLNEQQKKRLADGGIIKSSVRPGKYLCSYEGELIAVAEVIDDDRMLYPRKVFVR